MFIQHANTLMLAENDEPDDETNRNCENKAQGSTLKVLIVIFRIGPICFHGCCFLLLPRAFIPAAIANRSPAKVMTLTGLGFS